MLTQALIYAILAMSLDILLGYTGLASLGHAAYFGIGAYSVGILATRYGAGFWVTLPAGVLLAVAVAAIFGLVALRSTGVYFLMITLALGMVVWGLAHRWVTMTQGDNGISAIPRSGPPACRGRLLIRSRFTILRSQGFSSPSGFFASSFALHSARAWWESGRVSRA